MFFKTKIKEINIEYNLTHRIIFYLNTAGLEPAILGFRSWDFRQRHLIFTNY